MAEVHEELNDDLGSQVSHGLRWSAINQIVNRVLTFASGIVVLRVLSVDDVGIFGAAFAVTTLLMAVNELGLIPTIVRWEKNAAHAARTASTLAIASSCFWYVVIWIAAPLVARVIDSPNATWVIRVTAITIIVDGFTSIPSAFVHRDFRQRGLAIAEFLGMVVQIAVTIGLAVWGAGALSLAWGQTLSNLAAGVVIIFWVAPRIRPGWDRTLVRPLLRFSLPISGAALVRDGGTNLDSVVVGAALGTTQLGFYQLAFNLGSLPYNLVGTTVGRVTLPGFARLTDDKARMNAGLRRSTTFLAAATVPLVALVAALAEPIVQFVYGSKWEPAVPVLRLLVVLAGMRVVANVFIDALIAEGRTHIELIAYGTWIVVLLPGIWFGATHWGITGAGVVHLVVFTAVVFPVVLRALRQSGLNGGGALLGALRPTIAGVAGGLAAYGVSTLVTRSFVALLVGGAVGVAVTLALMLPGNHDVSWKAFRRWRSGNEALA